MSEIPRLREIAESMPAMMPDMDIATSMIANVEPKLLDTARAKTYRDAGLTALMSPKITLEAEQAEAEFDKALQQPGNEESKKEARKRLEHLLAQSVGLSQIEQEERIDLSLAHAISRKRRYLAKPLRWGATVSCAAILAPIGYGVSALAVYTSDHPPTKNKPTEVQPNSQKIEFSTGEEVTIGFLTAAFAIGGGVIGNVTTDGTWLERGFARWRAKSLLKKSND